MTKMIDTIKTLGISLEEYGIKEFPLSLTNKNSYTLILRPNDWITGYVKLEQADNSVILSLHVECIPYPYDYFRSFQSQKAIFLNFSLSKSNIPCFHHILAIHKYNPFWTSPLFISSKDTKCYNHLQHLLTDNGDGSYTHYMPLAGAYGIADMEYSAVHNTLRLCFHPFQGGTVAIDTTLAIITQHSNPYLAIEHSFLTASKHNLIDTPLRKDKVYPPELNGLGWCTWNAFYHDVTANKIRLKLEEFREKKIPVKWIMIDDGWFPAKDLRLTSFSEDRRKLPMGLKAFIREIKKNYDIEYVGVWHAFTGYWFGLDTELETSFPLSSNASLSSRCFHAGPYGILVSELDEESAFAFFDTWHTYLKEQGVDFLKVDAQGNALEFLRHMQDCCKKVSSTLQPPSPHSWGN